MRGLYAIVDLDTVRARRLDPLELADALLSARPCALQLRAKTAPKEEVEALLRELSKRKGATPLVVNDRWELALLCRADFVHVGQNDAPVQTIRAHAETLKIGKSTHSLAELDAALDEGPAYAAIGPVFRTLSKVNPEPQVTLDVLKRAYARAKAKSIPLVAIGGITEANLPEIAPYCDAVAMIGALVDGGYSAIAERARRIHTSLGGA